MIAMGRSVPISWRPALLSTAAMTVAVGTSLLMLVTVTP
jgi:hypothetical protein